MLFKAEAGKFSVSREIKNTLLDVDVSGFFLLIALTLKCQNI